MRKERILLLSVIILASLSVLILTDKYSGKSLSNPFASVTPYPTIIPGNNSGQAITMAPSSSQNIEVLSPRSGDKIKSGFVVKGNARTFESNVAIRLYDSLGNVLIETFTLANAPDVGQFGPFEKMINYETDSETGTLEVFQYSAKDGSQIDIVTVPVVFE